MFLAGFLVVVLWVFLDWKVRPRLETAWGHFLYFQLGVGYLQSAIFHSQGYPKARGVPLSPSPWDASVRGGFKHVQFKVPFPLNLFLCYATVCTSLDRVTSVPGPTSSPEPRGGGCWVVEQRWLEFPPHRRDAAWSGWCGGGRRILLHPRKCPAVLWAFRATRLCRQGSRNPNTIMPFLFGEHYEGDLSNSS